jgi:hypothetical protein
MSIESERGINKNAIQLYRTSDIVPQETSGAGKKSLDRPADAEKVIVVNRNEGVLPSYQANPDKTLSDLALGLGIGRDALIAIGKHFGIIKPSKREIMSEKDKERWQGRKLAPIHAGKLRQFHQDHDLEKKRGEAIKKANEKTDIKKKKSETTKTLYQNPDYRKIQLETLTVILNNEVVQQQRITSIEERWSDPKSREKQAEGKRSLRADPDSSERPHLPTIQGYRKDIDYNAESAWEANMARILKYTGQEFYPKESFSLEVPDQYRDFFKFEITQTTVDFIAGEPEGNLVAYDLIPHPEEDPIGIAKTEMFKKQYPEIPLHVVDTDLYHKLKRRFEKKINSSPDLCGWETSEDNLFTNPKKYTDQS